MPAKKKHKPSPLLRTPAPTKGLGRIASPQRLQLIERRYQAVQLRRQGYSMQEIADTLKCAVSTVAGDIRELLQLTAKEAMETTEEARQLEAERLDELQRTYYELARSNNMAAAALVLSIMDRRRKLLALDIPETKRLEHSGIREYVGVDTEQV